MKKRKKWRKNGEKTDNYTPPKPSSFGSSLSSAKKMCILIRTLKGGEDPGKTAFSFGSSFSLKKRMCASLFISLQAEHMCRHGDGKRNEKAEEKRLFSFYSSLSLAKRYVHLYTHLLMRNICAYMGNERKKQKWRKRVYLYS